MFETTVLVLFLAVLGLVWARAFWLQRDSARVMRETEATLWELRESRARALVPRRPWFEISIRTDQTPEQLARVPELLQRLCPTALFPGEWPQYRGPRPVPSRLTDWGTP